MITTEEIEDRLRATLHAVAEGMSGGDLMPELDARRRRPRGRLAAAAAAALLVVGGLAGVLVLSRDGGREVAAGDPDIVRRCAVFLKLGDVANLPTLDAALRGDPEVHSLVFFTEEQASQEFRQAFPDLPVEAVEVPASFRVQLATPGPAAEAAFTTRSDALPGVFAVTCGATTRDGAWRVATPAPTTVPSGEEPNGATTTSTGPVP